MVLPKLVVPGSTIDQPHLSAVTCRPRMEGGARRARRAFNISPEATGRLLRQVPGRIIVE